jgi:putative ABC transport system substrate-binding protein
MTSRRKFITLVGGAAAAWPVAARAQQPAVPVVGFISGTSLEMAAERAAAFRKGLAETGFVEGQNVTVEYHWLDGRYEKLPPLLADLVRRRVAVIATPGSPPASLAAKAATGTIPIVFGVSEDPVKLGLVASFARPGGNATGVNFFSQELIAKRLGLLHELVPRAVRIAVLVNPDNTSAAESTLRDLPDAARSLGLELEVLNISTSKDIEVAFAGLARSPTDALFVGNDSFFESRLVQLVVLSSRLGIPTSYPNRYGVEHGLLMSYGGDIIDTYRQVAVYAGRILKGDQPADLPVIQPTKFELAINLTTAKALGLDVSQDMLSSADEVIE